MLKEDEFTDCCGRALNMGIEFFLYISSEKFSLNKDMNLLDISNKF